MKRRYLVWCGTSMALALSFACDDGANKPAPSASRERSQAVVVAAEASPGGVTAPAVQAAPIAQKAGAASDKPRSLCEPREGNARKAVPPGGGMSRAGAPGEEELASRLPVGSGVVTWVNFWAAWCVPCREEIPRLLAWEKQLNAEGKSFRVVFVSLDDDERQLREFLAKQSAGGLRRTYWLREGTPREEWLAQVGMDTDPRLPVHLLVGTNGESHCVVDGAVEDEDLPAVRQLVSDAARQ